MSNVLQFPAQYTIEASRPGDTSTYIKLFKNDAEAEAYCKEQTRIHEPAWLVFTWSK